MRKFFNYESYAAWRASSGGASTEPVKLVGEGCFDWEEKFDMNAELATLRAENEMLREKLYDITGRSAMAFKQLHDSLLNQAKEALK